MRRAARAASFAAGLALGVACAGRGPAPREVVPPPSVPAPPAPEVRSLEVTATAYNAHPSQTDGDSREGAWGHRLEPGTKAVAVSPDLVAMGLTPGRTLRIEGLDGEWRVLDRMPDRWTRRIDLFMDTDVEAARAWGERRVRVSWEP
jgi:3D (Asp-Asp-Asp) domain-containing protein